ncbi:MAG: fibronectin type III domain-containing protein, partial [Longimicrobiales bacterium]
GAVDEYRIERRIGATGSFADHDTVAAGSLAYQDIGLAANTQYFYRIEACNTGGCSAFSSTAQATTLPDPPGAPSGLQADPVAGSPTTIDLQWTASTGTVTEYRIERRIGAGGEFVDRDIVAGTTISYRDTGLTASTQYVYRVEACNSGGCSSTFSNEASATTNPNPPGTPTNLAVSAVDSSSSAMELGWDASSGVVGEYRIERRTATGSFAQFATVPAGTLTYQDAGLTASTQYFYRVRACNAGGCSSYGNEAQASTNPAAPGAPSVLAAAPVAGSSSAIDIVWSPAVGVVVEYRIERRTGAEAFARVDTAPAGTTSYQDIGLTAGTLYVYRVAACNAGGCSSFTSEAEATTNP